MGFACHACSRPSCQPNPAPIEFDHFPDTTDGQLFCNGIIKEILAVEELRRKRRAIDQENFKKAAIAMLCRLLAVNDVGIRRSLFRPLREETFTSSSIKDASFKNVFSGLQALGYVDVTKGGNHKNQLFEYF